MYGLVIALEKLITATNIINVFFKSNPVITTGLLTARYSVPVSYVVPEIDAEKYTS
ncbi:hypothetical protein M2387_000524 [Klebsiella sp. BIGb0407]|nr:hypothetical protein [Klebsiella sp. BIGb0407]